MRNDRIKSHVTHGWQLFRTKSFELGDDAYRVEQATLKWLRNELELPTFLSSIDMPQGGWSETVSADEIDLVTIWEQVSKFANLIQTEDFPS